MYHVALVGLTNKRIELAEKYKSKAERDRRAAHLSLQAEMNEAGLNPDVEKGAKWGVAMGEEPYSFPEDAP
jgi:hypothetical protein